MATLFARALRPAARSAALRTAARPSLAAAAVRRAMSTSTAPASSNAAAAASAAAAAAAKRPQAVTAALKSTPVATAAGAGVPRRAAHATAGTPAADPIKGSHMSVRRWKVLPGASVAQIVHMCDTEFVPLIRAHPDFLCYYATVVNGAEYFSVSVFSSKKGADASAKVAGDWSARNLKDKIALFDTVDGETVVHHDSWTHMMSSQSEG